MDGPVHYWVATRTTPLSCWISQKELLGKFLRSISPTIYFVYNYKVRKPSGKHGGLHVPALLCSVLDLYPLVCMSSRGFTIGQRHLMRALCATKRQDSDIPRVVWIHWMQISNKLYPFFKTLPTHSPDVCQTLEQISLMCLFVWVIVNCKRSV